MTAEKIYSVEQAAEMLDISPLTLAKWLRAGKIRGVKIGRLWRIPDSALDEIAQSGTRRGIKPVSKFEMFMRVRDQEDFSCRCNTCGCQWYPGAGNDSDGETLMKMICPEGCNKPEGYEEEESRLRGEWFQEHEEDFQEYLEKCKVEDGKEDQDDEEEGASYVEEVRSIWEKETEKEREAFVDEYMADWMEEVFKEETSKK